LHNNDTFFAWYDASPRTLKEKLPAALERYEAKNGKKANFVMVNPIFSAEDRDTCAADLGIVMEESAYVALNTLYLTRRERQGK
jgi:hypothetical protein